MRAPRGQPRAGAEARDWPDLRLGDWQTASSSRVADAPAPPALADHGDRWPRSTLSRKTLIYLILTLNHIYPDYDFSTLRANHFRKESGSAAIEEEVDSLLLETSKARVFGAEGAVATLPRS